MIQYVTLRDVKLGRPQDVSMGSPLALHKGPYGDVHRTSFGDVIRTSSGRNLAEWNDAVGAKEIWLRNGRSGLEKWQGPNYYFW